MNYRPGCVLTRGGRAIATVGLEWDQHGHIAQVFTVRNADKSALRGRPCALMTARERPRGRFDDPVSDTG